MNSNYQNRIPVWTSVPSGYSGPKIYPSCDAPYMNRASLIRGDFIADRPTVNLPRFAVYSADRPYNQFAVMSYGRFNY